MNIKNPFKEYSRRRQYDGVVKMYFSKSQNLFTAEHAPNIGNALSAAFWYGYNGLTTGLANYESYADKLSASYVYYRAGKDIKKYEDTTELGE